MIFTLPYIDDSPRLFDLIAEQDWSILLDSGHGDSSRNSHAGRFDILATNPLATLVTRGGITTVTHLRNTADPDPFLTVESANVATFRDDPFQVLRDTLNAHREALPAKIRRQIQLPFTGGAMGYFSYDLGRRIEKLPAQAIDEEQLPEMAVALYDSVFIIDHQKKLSYLSAPSSKCIADRHLQVWQKLIDTCQSQDRLTGSAHAAHTSHAPFRVLGKITSNFTYEKYRAAFDKIKAYIAAGDCYQVNLAQRFSTPASGNLWSAYSTLKKLNPAPFSAFFNTPFGEILSSSPERFLSVENGKVSTKPIKGTRPRSVDSAEDKRLREELRTSLKDRAENVMIVDLLRNDLGKVCKTGSVRVPDLFEVESYATVHHMVSTITGELGEQQDAISLLRASFPGGSITGAPKIRAMEIIEELEPQRRGIYCGALGYIDFNGNMDTNIMIRSLIYNQGIIRFWVGGGIVHDSVVEAEYQETLDKGKAFFELLSHYQSAVEPNPNNPAQE